MDNIHFIVECLGWCTLLIPAAIVLIAVIFAILDHVIRHSKHYYTFIEYAALRKRHSKSQVWEEINKRYLGSKQ